jgi:GAF domain-containing protein
MRRRDKAGGKAAKTRRPKTLKRRRAPKITPGCSVLAAGKETNVEQLTRELAEAREREAATGEVLKVISRSAFNLQTVLDTLVASAARLCRADRASMRLARDGFFHHVASYGYTPEQDQYMNEHPVPAAKPDRGSIVGRVLSAGKAVQIEDTKADPEFKMTNVPGFENVHTTFGVPLLREGKLIGVLVLMRGFVEAFTDKQIELAETFAAQAVIAIENTRLLNELRESLQQQTATADVLKVISRSAFNLQTVLDTLVESAVRLCEADTGILRTREGEIYPVAATYRFTQQQRDRFDRYSTKPDRGSLFGRAVLEGRTIHVSDVLADPEYDHARQQDLQDVVTVRAGLAVPMMREGAVVGIVTLQRKEPRPFTDSQIQLVATFADQAVIAVENVRLFDEVQARTRDLSESLEQQTATADVLKVISRSTFDLQVVLDTLLSSAIRLCGTERGMIFRYDGDLCRAVAAHNLPREFLELWERTPIRAGRGTTVGRALLECRPVQIVDVKADPEYAFDEAQKMFAFRTVLAVPMLREGIPKGVIGLVKTEVEPFTDKQIALVETFADQAAIAIENVRLFESVEQRTRELAKSLEELRTTQDRLVQTQKLALLGQLTAGIAHEIKNPLNFVNNFSGVSAELIDELRNALKGVPLDDTARAEIEELTDTLKGNFDKVVHHGRRADAIVKNMLQHSREGSGEHRVIDINALVEESLNLAWHGARAETQGFEIKLKQSLDPSAGGADVIPQDIRRALLNLIANGFYAAIKRRAEANDGDYEPTLTASTKDLGDCVEIRIRDNGTGITPDVKEKMFTPFFTTKPTGEGTGLGLSISHDIIVKQHGGSIEVDTKPGEFAEISVILPRVAALLPERS